MSNDTRHQITAADICDAVGRQKIAERIQRGRSAVSNAAVVGRFPASWYLEVKALCDEVGVECPLSAFGFLEVSNETGLDAAPIRQAEAS
ncbi:MAG: hypothetical protein KDK03_02470 [Rhodobacteraceae bacterium]|nr:hypothetical protein [Paracoccaceae bacterium]